MKGAYTQQLLRQWDAYKKQWGSENIRPSCFDAEQTYVVLCLSNGGWDLESTAFDSANGWRQAASVFWQVARTLALAEQAVEFEVRSFPITPKVDAELY